MMSRRVRFLRNAATAAFIAVLLLQTTTTNAFHVHTGTTTTTTTTTTPSSHQRTRRTTSTQLSAVGRIPPPPPPPPSADGSGGLSSIFGNLLDKVQVNSEGVSLLSTTSSPADSLLFPNIDIQQPLEGLKETIAQVTQQLDSIIDFSSGSSGGAFLSDNWNELQAQIQSLDASILAQLEKYSQSFATDFVQQFPQAEPFYQKLLNVLQTPALSGISFFSSLSPSLLALVAVVLSITLLSSMSSWGKAAQLPPPSQPYPLYKYDAVAASAYFDGKIITVVSRALEILTKSLAFGANLLKDKLEDKMEEREYQRGEELAQLLTALGPTFIKVGQSLSIRTDLLSPAYARGLATLQDQVPAFDTAQARQILETQWGGRPVESVIDQLSAEPVAAASLGQVYKATLKSTGQEVAIKVQRPNIMNQIALDMYLLRQGAPVIKKLLNLNSDTVGTVDAWGSGFVDELDYLEEARNAELFSDFIATTPLKDVVFAPTVVRDVSTKSVLVTEWVDGQRLDYSSAEDVNILCSIAMNTYLSMLLEGSGGILHCDPHPGNLLRTPDGRLCILDWGMVTRLDEDLQLTLIEHVAHLTSSDYEEIPSDLLKLGFIAPEKAGLIRDSGLVEVLADIYGQWKKGGGAASINVNDVVNQLQDLTAEKGNLFQIPPYFAYIAKSFSVLEGIGITNDENYSIIDECLPYISKRLMTDNERCGPALSTFIFGPEKSKPDRVVNYKRVEQLVDGFGSYTTAASGALLGKENASRVELLEDSADQILDLVFVEEETPLQTILLEQLAKIMASNSRSFFTRVRERSGVLPSGRTVLGTIIDPLGVWRTSPLVRMNEKDEETVETTRKLVALISKQLEETKNPIFDLSSLNREEALALSSILGRKVWERRSSVVQTGSRFAQQALELTAQKLESGERDSRRLPPPRRNDSEDDESNGTSRSLPSSVTEEVAAESSPPVVVAAQYQKKPSTHASPRLQQARRLLDEIQKEEESSTAPQVVPLDLPRV